MKQKGQITPILAAVIIGIVVVAGLYIVLPRVSGGDTSTLPEVPGVTEKVVKADVDVKVTSAYWDWNEISVDIQDETVRTYAVNQLMTFEPLFWEDTYKGEVVVESINSGEKMDEKTKNFELEEAWHEQQVNKTFTFNGLELGEPDDGRITIKATLYNNNGVVVGTDLIKNTI